MEQGAVSTVAFSWEHEPGVSKQSPNAKKAPAVPAPASPKKAAAHRLYVPPPPGVPFLPPARSMSRTRGVRPEDDPFLAAYLACTSKSCKKGGGVAARESKGQKLFGWAGLGLGLSCKSSDEVVKESMVRRLKF